MRRRVFVAFGAVMTGALSWIACVGDAPAVGGRNPGERGAPCDVGRCLDGLDCIDNVCVALDATAGGEAGRGDGGGAGGDEDSGEGGVDPCTARAYDAGTGVTCPAGGPCSRYEVCCNGTASDGCKAEDAGACGVVKMHRCETASQCNSDGSEVCCGGEPAQGDVAKCPVNVSFPDGTSCKSRTAGCGTAHEICLAGDPHACPSGMVCRRAALGSVVAGVCVPD